MAAASWSSKEFQKDLTTHCGSAEDNGAVQGYTCTRERIHRLSGRRRRVRSCRYVKHGPVDASQRRATTRGTIRHKTLLAFSQRLNDRLPQSRNLHRIKC